MTKLLFLILVSCTSNKISIDSVDSLELETALTDTSDTSVSILAPSLNIETEGGFAVPRGDQIYDMLPIPSIGTGCILASNPYATNDSGDRFTGAVYGVCPGAAELPEDATVVWSGSGYYQALGCNIELSTLEDGTEVVGSSEFNDPTYEGRAFLWDSTEPSGVVEDFALLDIVGEHSGDGNTGGYFGTSTLVYKDLVLAGQTNAGPTILGAEISPLDESESPTTSITRLTLSDFIPLVSSTNPYEGLNVGGFAAYDTSSGEDGVFFASFGAIGQHISPEGTADWWIDETDSGEGEYVYPGGTDVTRWTVTSRLSDDTIVLSVFSREERRVGELTYARLLEPTTGTEIDDYSNVYGIADGTIDTHPWTAYGMIDCDPNYDDECRVGYIQITFGDEVFNISLPFENFPEAGCLLTLVSDNESELAWFCKDQRYGGFIHLSLEYGV